MQRVQQTLNNQKPMPMVQPRDGRPSTGYRWDGELFFSPEGERITGANIHRMPGALAALKPPGGMEGIADPMSQEMVKPIGQPPMGNFMQIGPSPMQMASGKPNTMTLEQFESSFGPMENMVPYQNAPVSQPGSTLLGALTSPFQLDPRVLPPELLAQLQPYVK